jgi:hypothetical protein
MGGQRIVHLADFVGGQGEAQQACEAGFVVN